MTYIAVSSAESAPTGISVNSSSTTQKSRPKPTVMCVLLCGMTHELKSEAVLGWRAYLTVADAALKPVLYLTRDLYTRSPGQDTPI